MPRYRGTVTLDGPAGEHVLALSARLGMSVSDTIRHIVLTSREFADTQKAALKSRSVDPAPPKPAETATTVVDDRYETCPHGFDHIQCLLCPPTKICWHDKLRSECIECTPTAGSEMCKHFFTLEEGCYQCSIERGEPVCHKHECPAPCEDCAIESGELKLR